jgi:hypothetical protein
MRRAGWDGHDEAGAGRRRGGAWLGAGGRAGGFAKKKLLGPSWCLTLFCRVRVCDRSTSPARRESSPKYFACPAPPPKSFRLALAAGQQQGAGVTPCRQTDVGRHFPLPPPPLARPGKSRVIRYEDRPTDPGKLDLFFSMYVDTSTSTSTSTSTALSAQTRRLRRLHSYIPR